jgi:hypothetical protein
MSLSEILTVILYFQHSPFKCFKHYYHWLQQEKQTDFPNLLSYSRFIQIKPRAIVPLFALFLHTKGKCSGISYIDATSLKVCHNRRIHKHRVFKDLAKRGHTSMGWFFGFKLHTVINHHGEIIDIQFTSGNVDDRKPVLSFGQKLFGYLFGDRGYISEDRCLVLRSFGVKYITKRKNNMKVQTTISTTSKESAYLKKRTIIETVFGEIKRRTNLEHTRHRSFGNFIVNLFSSLICYNLSPNKPSISGGLVS